MREIDELLKRRPDLGTLVGEAAALRARLANERGASAPGASALTAAELRLLPLLATHLSFPRDRRRGVPFTEHRQVADEVDLPSSWASTAASRPSSAPASSGSSRVKDLSFHRIRAMEPAPAGM